MSKEPTLEDMIRLVVKTCSVAATVAVEQGDDGVIKAGKIILTSAAVLIGLKARDKEMVVESLTELRDLSEGLVEPWDSSSPVNRN